MPINSVLQFFRKKIHTYSERYTKNQRRIQKLKAVYRKDKY